MLQIGTTLNERYEIVEKIGSGGMSIVYKARDKKLGRYVAVKVLRDDFCLDDNFVRKFKVEAQSAASLSHHHIVNIYDVGNEGQVHFIVMEYLEGVTLKDYIHENGPLNERAIMDISMGIAGALSHAHSNHIVHRDIKPQNILLTKDGKTKVTDFGIARVATDQTIDMPDNVSGSVYYIAPEQARGGYQDHKSDIYSLGITMYEMATGTLPFTGDNPVNVALKQIHDPMPLPSSINPNISQNLETIILKATEKKTTLRYQSIDEFMEDLQSAMDNPEDVLVYEGDVLSDETIVMNREEIDTIRTQSEVKEKEKDPLDKWVAIGGVMFSFIIVGLLALFAYNQLAKDVLPVDIEVPDVKNMTLNEATTTLLELGLEVEVTDHVYNDDVLKDRVITQNPDTGSLVLEDTVIDVVVSNGVHLVTVPKVAGQEFDVAETRLEKDELIVVQDYEFNETIPVGTVIRQEPESGSEVPLGTEVTIVISKGEEVTYVEVPDVIGLSIGEVTSVFNSVGLTVGNVSYVHHDTIPKDHVITMTVDAGKEVKEGYVIDLAVSLGPSLKPVSKTFTINNRLLPDEESAEMLAILEINGKQKEIYRETVTIDSFPITITVTETGEGILTFYKNGALFMTRSINFTEDDQSTSDDVESPQNGGDVNEG